MGQRAVFHLTHPHKGLQKQGLNQAEIMSQNSIQASHMGGRIPNKPSGSCLPRGISRKLTLEAD